MLKTTLINRQNEQGAPWEPHSLLGRGFLKGNGARFKPSDILPTPGDEGRVQGGRPVGAPPFPQEEDGRGNLGHAFEITVEVKS